MRDTHPASAVGPRALLVDYGGVLTCALEPLVASFCRRNGLADNAVAKLAGAGGDLSPLFRALERGEVAPSELLAPLSRQLGVEVLDLDDLFEGIALDREMVEGIAELRAAGVSTALVSNSWGTTLYDREVLACLFDAVLISGEIGERKPDDPLYQEAARRLGVEPQDCVFVDDTCENVTTAVRLGMVGVVHRDASDTLASLRRSFHPAR